MSVDDRLRAAFRADSETSIEMASSLATVHAKARRQTLRARASLGIAAVAVVGATLVVGKFLDDRNGTTIEPAVPPSPTPSRILDPELDHHQGQWETRELSRTDFDRTLTRLNGAQWRDELSALLPEGTMRLVQVVDGQDWTLSAVSGDISVIVDRRTIAGVRFMSTTSVEHPESGATFNHSSTEEDGVRVNRWSSVETSGPEYGDVPVEILLNALYTTAPFTQVSD